MSGYLTLSDMGLHPHPPHPHHPHPPPPPPPPPPMSVPSPIYSSFYPSFFDDLLISRLK